MSKFKVLDLFSGIGGFSLGLERTGGFETVAFCEIEPYCQKVLKKHWPKVPCYEDIRSLTADRLGRDGIRSDVITGGFPCQDISTAGKQAGIEGERSGLWRELSRLIGELRPRYAILENVSALLSGNHGQWFGKVLGDMASLGYSAEWHCIPASAIGAHHRRDRVWIIAYSDSGSGRVQSIRQPQCGDSPIFAYDGSQGYVADSNSARWEGEDLLFKRGLEFMWESKTVPNAASERCRQMEQSEFGGQGIEGPSGKIEYGSFTSGWGWWNAEPAVGRVANGIPSRVDRLRGLGNSVVPQIPELIGKAILEYEASRETQD